MSVTNTNKYPPAIARVLAYSDYSNPSQFSVTSLMRPVKENVLRLLSMEPIDFDVSERIDSFIGNAVHSKIEQILKDDPNYILEERLVLEYDDNPDFIKTIGGKYDIFDKVNQRLIDIKTTKGYKARDDADHSDWEAQLNCYAFMLKKCKGVDVKAIMIWAFVKDWNARDYELHKNKGYPKTGFKEIRLPLWTEARQYEFINSKIKDLIDVYEGAKRHPEGIRDCSETEMWLKCYAKSAGGAVRSVKNYAEFETKYGADKKWAFRMVPTRCERYCSVRKICPQAKYYRENYGI